MYEVIDLSRTECERLLRGGVVGRAAIATPLGPHVVPVNYAVVDDTIVIRTSPYSVLGTYGRDALVAFEVDQLDHERHRGWSVVARGKTREVTDPAELDRIWSSWPPRPWAAGSRGLHLRLPWTELSGRQLGTGWNAVAGMPVRRVV